MLLDSALVMTSWLFFEAVTITKSVAKKASRKVVFTKFMLMDKKR